MSFQVNCPNPVCGNRCTIDNRHSGVQVQCPKCREAFTAWTSGLAVSKQLQRAMTDAERRQLLAEQQNVALPSPVAQQSQTRASPQSTQTPGRNAVGVIGVLIIIAFVVVFIRYMEKGMTFGDAAVTVLLNPVLWLGVFCAGWGCQNWGPDAK